MTQLAAIRPLFARPTLPALSLLALLAAGCADVGSTSLTFWDVIFSMIVFFFWFMFIWIFISLFADIFRRDDLSGWGKAGWIFLLVILPFIGALIYIIARPRVTAGDVARMTRMEAATEAAAGVSTADEIKKLQDLKAAGVISDAEFEDLKKKAMS